jgi:hypothetical protein
MPRIADTQENMEKCICGGCPTYNDCMKEKMQGLFCGREKSDCEISKGGCLCGACPLASEFRLEKMYYCMIGAEE